jgi:hypothetical protein
VPSRPTCSLALSAHEASERTAFALRLWNEAHDPRGTIVADYLASRGLTLSNDLAGNVIRFHGRLKFDGAHVGAMVALYRDIASNEPCGIHRTFLNGAGQKLDRKMLGRAKGAAIKLDADDAVTLGLHIGEGLETCIAARLAGLRPVWALGSTSGIKVFPPLSGIEAISIFAENDSNGANERAVSECAERWHAAGREVLIVEPLIGNDHKAAALHQGSS